MAEVFNISTLFIILICLSVCLYMVIYMNFELLYARFRPMRKYFSQTRFEKQKYNFLVAKPKLFVTASVVGRLGNQMFQYASLMGIAHLNNGSHQAFYQGMELLPKAFQVTRVRNLAQGSVDLREAGFAKYDRSFARLPIRNVCVGVYLQSWKYFVDIDDFIRKEFNPVSSIKLSAMRMLANLTKGRQNATIIGVHVRRGDYTSTLKPGDFKVPPMSYFQKAAQYFRRKYPNAFFIVVSRDLAWSRSLLQIEDFVMAGRASYRVHMALLTLCDHVIMSIGTFGWWGGFLAGGEVVYYKDLIYPRLGSKEGFRLADHFRPEWVGISD